ncbi:hypothetical protein SAMN05444487_11031 [Marininema mesophilum]|uniref:Uncharacterized protein n=1 Tax=Marininema mesophilum TaxID=1048340 RepID=A0A1H2YWM0_9BACL|nr:hypothetical protein [Marininema mesophilum]SDX09435.1 hypothetical protein SAMN05444487_11031 [Marininema mesophilum]
MHVIRWSVALILVTGALMVLAAVMGFYVPDSWQYSLRIAGGVFFLLALITSGVMSIPSVHRQSKSEITREDWAFIFIICTIALFGISLCFN